MRCLSCSILLNHRCTNPLCRKIHGQATGKQCDWCSRKVQEAITLLNSAHLQYIDLTELLIQTTPQKIGIRYVAPLLQPT